MNPLPVRLRPAVRPFLVLVGLALLYYACAHALISLSTAPNGPVTTVWVPSGVAVAALVVFGPWAVLGSVAGAIGLALSMHAPLALALAVAVGEGLGHLLCWYLAAGRRGGGLSLEEVSDAPRLATAAVAGGIVSATASVTAYVGFGFIPAQAYLANWLTWVGSGASGVMLLVPLLVHAMPGRRAALARCCTPEGALALGVLAAAAFLWQGALATRAVAEPMILLVLLVQIWVAFRLEGAAVALANCVVAASAVAALVLRLGHARPAESYPFILSLQLMLVGVALVGWLLLALVARQRLATRALQEAQDALVAGARDAGRAEIATNVLHNVGNVLNSVIVSAHIVAERLKNSRLPGMARAVQLIQEHPGDLGTFLTQDAKGRLLPGYLAQASRELQQEHRELLGELDLLERNIGHIKDVVATQQTYAGAATVLAPVRLSEVVEDAVRLDEAALARAGVTVVREFADVPVATLDKTRIVQVLVNLISNARHAMEGCDGARRLTLRVGQAGAELFVSVQDEGQGIPAENLTRIFSHGFTTREGGHGFGLHSSALAAADMGGRLAAHSDGPGAGATFTLSLPAARNFPA